MEELIFYDTRNNNEGKLSTLFFSVENNWISFLLYVSSEQRCRVQDVNSRQDKRGGLTKDSFWFIIKGTDGLEIEQLMRLSDNF